MKVTTTFERLMLVGLSGWLGYIVCFGVLSRELHHLRTRVATLEVHQFNRDYHRESAAPDFDPSPDVFSQSPLAHR